MRLAIVDDLPEGGAKKVVRAQIKFFARKHQVFYITNTLKANKDLEEYCRIYTYNFEVKLKHGWLRPIYDIYLWGRYWLIYRKIFRLLKKLQIEAVIFHPCRLTQAPMGLWGKLPHKFYFAHEWCRLVFEPENHPIKEGGYKKIYEIWRRKLIKAADTFLVHQADLVITTNHYNREHLWQAYKVKAYITGLGVDTNLFKPNHHKPKKEYYLFIGEKDDFHGYPLVEEVKALSEQRVKIKILSLSQGKFALSEEELIETYRGAIATLCLDRMEPFGLIPVESMACGVPVIAINEGGYRESVVDGETGFLVERSPQAVYHKLLILAQDKDMYQKFSLRARDRAIKYYQADKHHHELAKLILNKT